MYDRLRVKVHPLGPFTLLPADNTAPASSSQGGLIPTTITPLAAIGELAEPIQAQTYVWCKEDRWLEEEPWSFDEFVRKNAWKWIGNGTRENEDRVGSEVDVVRDRLNGNTAPNGA
jgi:hypothetical protein